MAYERLNLKDGTVLTAEHLRHIEQGIIDASIPSDWNRNDPTKPEYVENRTHWKETEENVEIFNEQGLNNGQPYRCEKSLGLEVGELYWGYYGEAPFNAIGAAYEYGDTTGVMLIDPDEYDPSVSTSNTGLPFNCIDLSPETAAAKGYAATVVPMDGSQNVHIIIVGNKTTYHPLDKRFLPDDIGGVKTVNGKTPDANGNVEVEGVTDYNKLENKPVGVDKGETVILPEITVEIDPENGQGMFANVADVKVGNVYTVTWNGTEYFCEATLEEGDFPMICLGNSGAITGGTPTVEPFVLLFLDAETAASAGFGGAVVSLDGSVSVTLSVNDAIVHTLANMYLPKMVVNFTQVNEDTSNNAVADKSFEEVIAAVNAGYEVIGRLRFTQTYSNGNTTYDVRSCAFAIVNSVINGASDRGCVFTMFSHTFKCKITYGPSDGTENTATMQFEAI